MSTKQLQQRLAPPVIIALSGINHQTAAVARREQLALNDEKSEEITRALCALPEIAEAACYSTCNRTEVVVVARSGDESQGSLARKVEAVLCELIEGDAAGLRESLYHLGGRSAVQHLFRVASGLDSMILGETQILGQLKRALEKAKLNGAARSVIGRLFDRAFRTAKRARTDTQICVGAVSISYAAKELAQEIFGPLKDATVLLCGAGETAELMLKHLIAGGVEEITVANRSLERAAALVKRYGGAAVALEQARKVLPRADIVIGSCSLAVGQKQLFSGEDALAAAKERSSRPQFFIDLGVPRNFAADVNEVDTAFLYNIDDLSVVVDSNKELRAAAAAEAEEIVSRAADEFLQWLHVYSFHPIISEVYRNSEEFGCRQVELTLKRLRPYLSGPEEVLREALIDLTRALSKQILAKPVSALKADGLRDPAVADAFRELFEQEKGELKKANG